MTPTPWVGMIDETGVLHFEHPRHQQAFCQNKLAGQRVDIIIAPYGQMKSRKQECGFHAMITPWAREGGHHVDDLKRDLLRAIFGEREHDNPITGQVELVLREPHTSKLTKAQYSELIERTLIEGAKCGQHLVAPDEHRRGER